MRSGIGQPRRQHIVFIAGILPIFMFNTGCLEIDPLPAGCTSDADCSEAPLLVCDTDTGLCVAAVDDPPEPPIEPDVDCVDDAQCDDGVFCNGAERCNGGICDPGDAPCVQDETCNEDVNECVSLPLTCSLAPSDPCGGRFAGSSFKLTSAVENVRGTLTYMWTASQGVFDDPTLPNPSLTLGASALGSVTITLVVTDTFASGETTISVDASCELNITITGIPLIINAGPDRVLFPRSVDFGGSVPFSPGAYLASGQPGGAVPAMTAIANRGPNSRFTVAWEVVGVPAQARIEDISLTNADSLNMTYWIAPNPNGEVSAIVSTGQLVTLSNIVVPGTYTFRVTMQDVCTGDVAFDEVAHTLIPSFDIVADGP